MTSRAPKATHPQPVIGPGPPEGDLEVVRPEPGQVTVVFPLPARVSAPAVPSCESSAPRASRASISVLSSVAGRLIGVRPLTHAEKQSTASQTDICRRSRRAQRTQRPMASPASPQRPAPAELVTGPILYDEKPFAKGCTGLHRRVAPAKGGTSSSNFPTCQQHPLPPWGAQGCAWLRPWLDDGRNRRASRSAIGPILRQRRCAD